MELADVVDSKSIVGSNVPVRVRPPAPLKTACGLWFVSFYFIQTMMFSFTKGGHFYMLEFKAAEESELKTETPELTSDYQS